MGDIAAFVFYYVLLGLWVLFVWPALKVRGGGRVMAVVAVVAGVAATVYELWFWFVWSPVAPIRLDIMLLSVVLVAVYGTGALVLFGSDRRWTAAAVAAAVLVAGGGMLEIWIEAGREGRRLTAAFERGNALLFEAKFRNRATYRAYFGPLDRATADLPVGHWQAPDGSHYSRLVVNAEGRSWLFYRCGETECHFGPEGSPLRSVPGAIDRWQATLVKRGVGQRSLMIARDAPSMLFADVDQHLVRFTRAEPPIAKALAREPLEYLGSFVDMECVRQHARVRQLWLWRAEPDLLGVGIVSTLVAGRRADFTAPMVLGTGIRTGSGEDADERARWRFQWRQQERRWRAAVGLQGSAVSLDLERDGRVLPSSVLGPGSYFHDEVIDLAPLISVEDWRRWFETVLVGHFSSGEIPNCPKSATRR